MYQGEKKGNLPHGKGKITYVNGESYEGDFSNGQRHGQGKYTYLDGGNYEGEWRNNVTHGHGKSTYANGKTYVGHFENGQVNGEGRLVYPNGDYYEGSFAGGKFCGHGKFVRLVDNATYVGEWQDQKHHGRGTLTFYAEDKKTITEIYEGDWFEGHKHGQGECRFPDGKQYKGDWQLDQMNGRGEIEYPNGNRYVGQLENGLRSGQGALFYKDGRKYEGQWRDNFAEGQGIFTWVNGDVYQGEFVKAKKHGRGILQYANGDRYEGNWEAGKAAGHGVMHFSTGDLYDGMFDEGRPDGAGVMTMVNGDRYDGIWEGFKGEGRRISARAQSAAAEGPGGPQEGPRGTRCRWIWKNGEIKIHILSEPPPPPPASASECLVNPADLHDGVKIGAGGFGEVAWKTLTVQVNDNLLEEFYREVTTMRRPAHPPSDLIRTREPWVMVGGGQEFMHMGTLHELIHNPRFPIDIHKRLDYAYQIASGMSYLHGMGMIHKDLKPLNVLVSSGEQLKISDFGLSKFKNHSRTVVSKRGTPAYSPPESYSSEKCDEKIDVFSFGIILWELWSRQLPYGSLNFQQIMNAICTHKRPRIPDIDPRYRAQDAAYAGLMQHCWTYRAPDRPPFTEILATLNTIRSTLTPPAPRYPPGTPHR
ncbi:putative phosphatidylinositol-4-phosphate 5-kinase [Paratrimastix pyriformis]|uniref:Phosphatidylinositol-4-phosphate 5-kinase n=1 Tax=Paratrimastix pyriformis TaxID=342808 RepID=A0ABQ8UL14_9EUKA|nr:putative phosphatidylinositol-4-phosphate 5-kinase [Paratrimastix pyriformis]